MSKYTGRFDLYDELIDLGDGDINKGFNRLNGTKIYIQTDTNLNRPITKWGELTEAGRKRIEYIEIYDVLKYLTN